MKILAYVKPIKDKGENYLCFVEVLEGDCKNYYTEYPKSDFEDCPFGATLAFLETRHNSEPEVLKPDRKVLKDFGCSCTYCVTYNFYTHDVMTAKGEIYNLMDCMFTKHNKQTTINMLNALRTCENANIQLILKMGKVLDIGVYPNKKKGDVNYETAMQFGMVSMDKILLKNIVSKQEVEGHDGILTQAEIDKLLTGLPTGEL